MKYGNVNGDRGGDDDGDGDGDGVVSWLNASAAHADTRGVHVRTVATVQIRERVKGNDITMSCTAGRARLVRVDTVAVGIHVLRGQFKWQSRANMMLQGLRTRVCGPISVQTHTACNQPVISDAI